ncbi:hypothetical protein BDB00DRAFT_311280 [Zychaea mexicana]|uniref:uncharacterized protein n=1 Tax=Zychaea mexicana TaxID=64656 RepID=UPI0022FDF17C|nr:uncharacterized protein BDB00DRAFT_311280 [Zychaea mexicana]KAI9494328.1 hypothetical protein BDB00DRAFT_311280 [Zychaea mexicana]
MPYYLILLAHLTPQIDRSYYIFLCKQTPSHTRAHILTYLFPSPLLFLSHSFFFCFYICTDFISLSSASSLLVMLLYPTSPPGFYPSFVL